MAKTIKFNLICDGKPVRTLEDLKNNFSIEDIITYYNNKLLQRWLNVRGYKEELEKVEILQELDTLELIKELIVIFEIETNPIAIEENTYMLEYKQEMEFLAEEYKKINFEISTIIDDYHVGYIQLVETIIENKNDIAKIKAVIKEIDRRYFELYELDYHNLFFKLHHSAPLAVFVMLMNSNMRKKYLPIPSKEEDGTIIEDIYKNSYKKQIYSMISELTSNHSKLKEVLGENLQSFAGITDGYWKDVETGEKQYMILKMESGNYIRSTGISGGDLGSAEIKNTFIILDGIDYKSNNENHKLFYMEV
ncbi:hypothetical protein [Psychrobacillus sp. NPDC096389]|uniref:hypothetical protein n=1 Tax=Psychrobacillus sp. NPDC096389 TaxID=3364490 RepID=UPI0037FAD60F